MWPVRLIKSISFPSPRPLFLQIEMTGNIEVQVLLELITKSATEALDEYGKYGDSVPSVYETNTHPLDEHKMSLRLKKAIRNLEGACDQLCATLAPPLHTIVNVCIVNYKEEEILTTYSVHKTITGLASV